MADNLSAEEALARLLEGNRRFVAGSLQRPHQSPARRIEVADAARPFACILGCSDSRVPPELVFDQGLGDLFVIRTAGHTTDEAVLASVAYAVEHYGIRLVLVLGHQNCGAVRAVIEGAVPAHLAHFAKQVQPAVKRVKLQPSALVDNAVRMHTALTVQALRLAEPLLSKEVKQGRVTIFGGYYDLNSGSVTLLE